MVFKKRLSDSETIILKVLWEAEEPLSIAQITELLQKKNGNWAYTTVATFLKRMENKELVSAKKVGRSYYYKPEVKEGETVTGAVKYVDKYFKGSLNEFLAAFTKEKGLTAEEIKELKEWVEELDNDTE